MVIMNKISCCSCTIVYLHPCLLLRTMLKDICRLCCRKEIPNNSLRIFENKNMLWNIQILTGLILEDAKCLPDLICIECEIKLCEAIAFSDKVIAAQQQLLSALSEEELQDVSDDYKRAVSELTVSSCDLLNSTTLEITETSNKEPIIGTQSVVKDIIVEDYAKQNELMDYDIIIDDNAAVQKREVEERNLNSIVTLIDETHCLHSNEVNQTALADVYSLTEKVWDEENEAFEEEINKKIKVSKNVSKKMRGRKPLGNLIFVCDECGINISGRMAFELHCRRHRGDKQFECAVCQDRFCTSSELKSHMRRHTGERPFACHYCERFFADNSTRIKHERTHTNERPYACKNCGKAFTTTYILKNHMLTHSAERAFKCESCDKTFRRHTHLVTHCRSRAHKRKQERQCKEIQTEN